MGFLSDVAGAITGSTAADAARSGGRRLAGAITEAGDVRAEGGRDAFDFFMQQLSPFAQFDQSQLSGLNALATDPQAQMDFLTNNPLFEALKNQARESTFRTQSATGALGSSATDEILQNAFLTRGNELINSQINRGTSTLFPQLQSAQNAATNLAQMGGGALSGIKEALAAAIEDAMQAKVTGSIGAANAKSQGINNILGGIGAISGSGGIGKIVGGLL